MSGEPDVPTADAVGFANDSTLTPRENTDRAVEALSEHVDDLTTQVAEEFIGQYVHGSGRTITEHVLVEADVGLDAHPALPVWQANTVPWIERRSVFEGEERSLWRQYERGLRVVQVGDATRPLASGEFFDYAGTEAVVELLREKNRLDLIRMIVKLIIMKCIEYLLLGNNIILIILKPRGSRGGVSAHHLTETL